MQCAGTKLGTSAKLASDVKLWAISLAPETPTLQIPAKVAFTFYLDSTQIKHNQLKSSFHKIISIKTECILFSTSQICCFEQALQS